MIYSISGLNSRHLGRLSDSWHGHNLSYWTLQHFPISRFDCTPQKHTTWIKKRVYLMHHPHLFSPFLGFCAGPRVTRHIHQKAIVDKDQTQMFGKCLNASPARRLLGPMFSKEKSNTVSQVCWVLIEYYKKSQCPLGWQLRERERVNVMAED